jgi:hypothetical protein
VPKLWDIVRLYVDAPAHAIVLSVDEKSQILALDRTRHGLPPRLARPCGARNLLDIGGLQSVL